MNAKIMLAMSVSFNAVLLGTLTYVCGQIPGWDILSAKAGWVAKAGSVEGVRTAQPDAFAPRPGAVIEALLPVAKHGERGELFDFETGRLSVEPVFDYNEAQASIAWVHTKGLDISAAIVRDGKPLCIGYYLAVVPVNHQLWDTITPADIQVHQELAQVLDPKRPFIVPTHSNTDTFIFRTAEGTSGILQVLGVTEDRRYVKVHYKLLSPVQSPYAHHAVTSSKVLETPAGTPQP